MAVTAATMLGVILVAASGAGLVVQNGMNATLGTHAGSAFSGIVSFCTGLVVITVYFLVDVYGVGSHAPTLSGIRGAPWWSWLGGTAGAFYVVCAIVFAKPLGAGTLTAVSVAAQLLAAIAFDACGLLGFPRRRVHWVRLLGACLLVAGVVLMTVFQGAEVQGVPEARGQAGVPLKRDAAAGQADSNAKGVDQHVVELSAASGAGNLPAEWP